MTWTMPIRSRLRHARNAVLHVWSRSRAATIASTAAIQNAGDLDRHSVACRGVWQIGIECRRDRSHKRSRLLHHFDDVVGTADQPIRFEFGKMCIYAADFRMIVAHQLFDDRAPPFVFHTEA